MIKEGGREAGQDRRVGYEKGRDQKGRVRLSLRHGKCLNAPRGAASGLSLPALQMLAPLILRQGGEGRGAIGDLPWLP